MAKQEFDVIVVGAGHNGLVTACYLARAGLKVMVLERSDRVGGAPERGVHAVAPALDYVPVVRFDRRAETRVVRGDELAHRVGPLFPQPRRALDVGEEKGHRARGRLRCHDAVPAAATM